MYYCYIDESGNSEVITLPNQNVQPLLVLGALIIDANHIQPLTKEFISLKRKFFPNKFKDIKHDLDALQEEIKGSDIRSDIRKNTLQSKIVDHHFKFLDAVFVLVRKYDARLISRIWVKGFGAQLLDKSIYTKSTQEFCRRFQEHLNQENCVGTIIADFRDPHRNSYTSHSVFTQKYKQTGDQYPSVFELPTFAISNNHACLQIVDLFCSAIIAPIAGIKFCGNVINNPHTHKNYQWIKSRYSKRLKSLQFNCYIDGKIYWGITANNPHDKHNQNLF